MSKVYVIGRVGWEYNDEVMYRGEGGGSVPTMAYKNKEVAEKACSDMNIEWLLKERLESFCFSLDELFTEEGCYAGLNILEQYGITSTDDFYGREMSKELAEQLLPYLAVVGYEITEVELV